MLSPSAPLWFCKSSQAGGSINKPTPGGGQQTSWEDLQFGGVGKWGAENEENVKNVCKAIGSVPWL